MSQAKDFFISRAGADAEAAAWIAQTLEAAGFSCTIQQRDFTLGGHFPLAMEDAFENCRATIAVLSPDYTASPYCRDEWSVAYVFHRKQGGGRLLPVRVMPGHIPPLAEALAYIDLVAIAEGAKAEKLLAGVRTFRERGELPETLEPDARPLVNHDVVFDTPHFAGREQELTTIHEALWGKGETAALTQPAAVTGLGGVGKSAIGKEYARRHLHRYCGAWLVNAEQEATLLADLAELGGRLNRDLREAADVRAAAQAGLAEARRLALTGRPFLLLLDNVETPADMPEWVRGQGLHVVITSRYATWPNGVAAIEIEELPPQAARTLLLETANRDAGAGLDQLLAALEGLPLALVQAGAYLRENPSETFAHYCEALARRLGEASDDWPRGQRLIAATYAPSLDRAEMSAPGARDLITRAAFYAPDDIPLLLLTEAPESEPFRRAADALARYSLWRLGADGPFGATRSLHRVLQTVLRAELTDESLQAIARTSAATLANSFKGNAGDVSTWGKNGPLAAHTVALSAATPDHAASPELAKALGRSDQYFDARADYRAAEPLSRRALAIDEASFGPDHPKVAIRLNNLAALLRATNRLGEAEPLMRRALAIAEASFGPDHPNVATGLNNLAGLLQATNRLGEAEPLMRRALAIDEASFGPDHPNVAIRLNNLAGLLRATNRLGEAEPLYRRALAIDEASFGPDHPKVATRLNNLAALLQATNRLAEAEPLAARAVRIFAASFGRDHPSTQTAGANLAGIRNEMRGAVAQQAPRPATLAEARPPPSFFVRALRFVFGARPPRRREK